MRMKKPSLHSSFDRRHLFPLLSILIAALIVVLTVISCLGASSTFNLYRSFSENRHLSELDPGSILKGSGFPPAFAYWISGTRGQRNQIFRLLKAVYHPRNQYLLHLDADASNEERDRLAVEIQSVRVFRVFGNVNVVGKADSVRYMGPSNIAATLHAAAILLRIGSGWDWFITLSAADYPLITQDDLFHVFSFVRRDLNFIDHTSDLGWKEYQRAQPIIVDPGLYLSRRAQIFHATQRRETPDAFKFFTGSPWVILSRPFIEFCILGWDNLPRTLLMYFSNALLSEEGYFHSVLCNSPEFQNTTVNNDLRYLEWDSPPKPEPHFLNLTDYDKMVESRAAFARQFHGDDPVLKKVDDEILNRGSDWVIPGAWCLGKRNRRRDPCSRWGDVNFIKPGKRADKFGELIFELVEDRTLQSTQCK